MKIFTKELHGDYRTAQQGVDVLTDRETFIYSFRLSARTVPDVPAKGQMSEI